MSEKSGTDARFPYELRQNVVVGLVLFLLREQEVAGSNPVAPTELSYERRQAFALSALLLGRANGLQKKKRSQTGCAPFTFLLSLNATLRFPDGGGSHRIARRVRCREAQRMRAREQRLS